jgi:hypothetical protein
MPAYYTVVQYVPDPIADERVNVGVIVFADGQLRSRFLADWRRVSRFAQEDIGYVREFADWVGDAAVQSAAGPVTAVLPGFAEPFRADEQTIRRIAEEWSNSIQLTPPQPSLEDPDALLLRMARTHLREATARKETFRDRQDAARYVVSTVKRAFNERLGPTLASDIVRPRAPINGKVVENLRVDMAITNGRIYSASQALSFETHNMADLDRQVRDAVYTLEDIGELSRDVRRDLVVLPPRVGQANYRGALRRFDELRVMSRRIGAGLVTEHEIPDWGEELADTFGREIVANQLRSAGA